MAHDDPALQALMLPFEQGLLPWPEAGGVLFLRARDGAPLHRRAWPGLVCEQGFKPEADALRQAGLVVVDSPDAGSAGSRHPLVLVLPPRQRDEARALYAHAVSRVAPGGRVVACLANNEGAKSGEADLRRLVGPLGGLLKHKSRCYWSAPLHVADSAAVIDHALLAEWEALDAPRPIVGGRFRSRPGVFAWDRIDPASALLDEQLPADLAGRAADLGAGFGYLSAELIERCTGIAALDLFEADRRALDLARHNLAAFESKVASGYHWHDVTTGLPAQYDVIVTNPPFHTQGSANRPDIGRRFIAVAADALKPGGRLWLVANRHLPYESVLVESFGQARAVAERDGFKIIEAVKARPVQAPRPPRRGREDWR